MLMTSHLEQKGLVHHQECSISTSSDPMLPFRLMRITSETPLLERVVDQSSLFDTNIPKWFAYKDWNYLLSDLDVAYENLVKEFYANAIVEGGELKCWVRRKSFSVSPTYFAEILHINRPMLKSSLVFL